MADDRAGQDVSELDKLDKAALLKVCRLSSSNFGQEGILDRKFASTTCSV